MIGKLKHEIVGEPSTVSLNGLNQRAGLYAVKAGQSGVEQHFLAAHQQDRLLDLRA